MQPNTEGSPIQALPEDVILELGWRLRSTQDVLTLSLSCSLLYRTLLPVLYENVHLRTSRHCRRTLRLLSTPPSVARFVRVLKLCPVLGRGPFDIGDKSIRASEATISQLIADVASNLRGLVSFTWEGLEQPGDIVWTALRMHCSSLRCISSSVGVKLFPEDCSLFDFDNLTSFTLRDTISQYKNAALGGRWQSFPPRLWEMLLVRCPGLASFSIEDTVATHRVFDLSPLEDAGWPRLRRLAFGDFNSEDVGLAYPELAAYTGFDLSAVLRRHPNLQELVLLHVPARLEFRNMDRIQSFTGRCYLPSHIELHSYAQLVQLPALTSLNWTRCLLRDALDLCECLRDLPLLMSLQVKFVGLRTSSPHMKTIFAELLKARPTLRHLNVECCLTTPFSTSDFTDAISLSRCLESFVLVKSHASGDRSIDVYGRVVTRSCPSLRWFKFECMVSYKQEWKNALSWAHPILSEGGEYTVEKDPSGQAVALSIDGRRRNEDGELIRRRLTEYL